ncbi:MAG: pseudouridine synthase [Burkholderiales bacterium]|nr:MAG: pseudouridine synthase [Burkholderiales bacterium]
MRPSRRWRCAAGYRSSTEACGCWTCRPCDRPSCDARPWRQHRVPAWDDGGMTDPAKKTLQLKTSTPRTGGDPLRRPVRSQGPARARPLSEVRAEREARDAARASRPPSGPPQDRAARPASPGKPAIDAPRTAAPQTRRPATGQPAARAGGQVRLNKRLADLGLCSRREADEWIERGWVLVNGQVASMGLTVDEADRLEVLPAARRRQEGRVTILLHKPVGYVSGQPEDGHESAAVLVQAKNQWRGDPQVRQGPSWQPHHARGLAPAGRLDIDSTGLLVLTQDGRIARQLIGEDSDIEKEYLVRVQWAPEGPRGPGVVARDVQSVVPDGVIERLRHGLSLDGKPLRPAQVEWQNAEQLRFVLREGRKRQIRRMCEQVGLHVVGLKRIRMGRIVLGNLPPGQWRYLRADEGF